MVKLILGVSKEEGIEAFHFVDIHFNMENYSEFLRKIKVSPYRNHIIFCDIASYHTGWLTRQTLAELGLGLILNVAYRPELNSIEKVFSSIKSRFREIRLRNFKRM